MEEVIPPEEEKAGATLPELVEEADIVPEPSPAQMPPSSKVPVLPEQGCHTPRTRTYPRHLTANRTMVYVPDFGWIKGQGPNHAEYAEDMYENDNKIRIME